MRTRRLIVHAGEALLEGALIATLVAMLAVGTTFAAKGGNSSKPGGHHGGGATGTGAIALAPLVVDANDNGTPNWGDVVTFTISTTATDQPWVYLACVQNGTLVAQGWDGYFDGSLTGRNFGLYSPQWSSGSADCTASLETPSWAVLAKTSFHVDP